jgi:hypothetical protein
MAGRRAMLRKRMTINVHPEPSDDGARIARPYAPDLLPLLQSLLATLADIDFAHESDLEVVQNSTTDEVLKRTVIKKLQERHRERRAPYVQQLTTLQERILVRAA